jgi:hypothetical protein
MSQAGSDPPAAVSASSKARLAVRAVQASTKPIGGRAGSGMAAPYHDYQASKR